MSSLGEFELIAAITDLLGGRRDLPTGVAVGSGDDAAILSGGHYRLLTVDTMVRGTHWDPQLSSPADVGFKLLASNLSDIAAMGGRPGPFLLALTLPRPIDAEWVLGMARGIDEARRAHRLDPAEVVPFGGDVTSTDGPEVLTLVLLGREVRPGRRLLRAGAQAGDEIWVSGPLGCAAAGLAALRAGLDHPELADAHRRPRARVDLAPALTALDGVHAAMDLSDGLAGDLPHVLTASQVGAEISLPAIPGAAGLRHLAALLRVDPLEWLLGGGEDYELLVTADPGAHDALRHVGLTHIGRCTAELGLRWLDGRGAPVSLAVAGFRHA